MKGKVVLGGLVVAAIAGSSCCIGPPVGAVLGLGAFTAASAFEVLPPG